MSRLTYDGNDCAGCESSAGHGYDRKFLLQPPHVSRQPLLLRLRAKIFPNWGEKYFAGNYLNIDELLLDLQ